MKNLILLFMSFNLFTGLIYGQQASCEWAQRYLSDNGVYSQIESMSDNSIVCSGVFTTYLNIFGHAYSSYAQNDVYIAAANEDGSFKWIKRNMYSDTIYMESPRTVNSLHVLQSDNIALIGTFNHRIEFDGISVYAGPQYVSVNSLFLFLFDPSGNAIRGSSIYCHSDVYNPVSAVNSNSDIFICSSYNDTVYVSSDTIVPQADFMTVVSRYNSSGDYQYSFTLNSASYFNADRITCDNNGFIYLCGVANGTVDLGNGGSFGSSSRHFFVVKLTSYGDLVSYNEILIPTAQLTMKDIKVLDNKVYIGGQYYDKEFTYMGQTFVYPDSNYNAFLAVSDLALDSLAFNMSVGQGEIVSFEGNNNGYVFIGYHDINIYHDFFDFPYNKIYYAKMNDTGNIIWNISSSEPHNIGFMSTLYDFELTPSGSLYANGNFITQMTLGTTVLTEDANYQNGFICKIAQNVNVAVTGIVTSNGSPVQNCYVLPLKYGGNSQAVPCDTLLTSASGSFSFYTNIPGTYYFLAYPLLCGPGVSAAYNDGVVNWFGSQGLALYSDTIVNISVPLNHPYSPSGTQNITGVVKDVFGNPRPNSIVNLMGQNNSVARTTLSNALGNFSFLNIPDSAYDVMVDIPFLPMLNVYNTANHTGSFAYIVSDNFIDTGSVYLPQPQDTLSVDIYTCEIDSTIPIDSAFAYIAYYSGNDIYIYLEVYQNSVLYDTLLTVPYQYTGLNVIEISFICTSIFKGVDSPDLTFYLDVNPLTTDGILQNPELKLYPNPASDVINLCLFTNNLSSVEISDNLGRCLIKQNIAAGNNRINIEGLLPGFYIISATGTNGLKYTKRFIKE